MICEIKEIPDRLRQIEQLKSKIAYSHFNSAQVLPYCVYIIEQDSEGADDMHNLLRTSATIELYQKIRDFELEKSIFKAFEDVQISTQSSYISDEKMYMTAFNFEFFVKL